MPENYMFRTEIQYDKSNYWLFQRTHTACNRVVTVAKCFLLVIILLLTVSLSPLTANTVLHYTLFILVLGTLSYVINRCFNLSYKRMLQSNMGKPPHIVLYFCGDGIHSFDDNGNARGTYAYDQIRHVYENKQQYCLMLKYSTGLMVDKAALTGGSTEEFINHLSWQCAKWKGNVRTGKFGRVMEWIVLGVTVAALALSICNLPGIDLFGSPKGTLTNDMTYEEMARELAQIGITISDQAIGELQAYDTEYYAEYGSDYYEDNPTASKIYDLLYWESAGFYDEYTWDWTPSTSGVYYFETEVWNVDRIYSDFFLGLTAMHSELDFTGVTEDYSHADLEAGTGNVTVSFFFGGKQYTLTEEYDYDWFDMTIVYEIGDILALDDSENELFYYYDGLSCMLYYGTEAQAEQLAEMTGLSFSAADLNS